MLAARAPLEEMGPVPQRAPVGHGARGLQRARQRVGLLPARSRAQPRVSLGRGRPRRHSAITSSGCASSLALWNGRDPILKERLFGLTNGEGNHGEDVKELYYYLDATPTHSYLKMLYKYPQREYPVRRARRGESPPRHGRAGVRAARHRRVRRRPLLRRVRRVREGGAGRHADARHGAQPRSRGGDAARAAAAVVPQHLVLDATARRSRRWR